MAHCQQFDWKSLLIACEMLMGVEPVDHVAADVLNVFWGGVTGIGCLFNTQTTEGRPMWCPHANSSTF